MSLKSPIFQTKKRFVKFKQTVRKLLSMIGVFVRAARARGFRAI